MSYICIKEIKGRCYIYFQETYRYNGDVKTKNRYIGPADSAITAKFSECKAIGLETNQAVSNITSDSNPEILETLNKKALETKRQLAQLLKSEEKKALSKASPSKDSEKKLNSKIRHDLYHISVLALEKQQEVWLKGLGRIGINIDDFPVINMVYGKKIGVKKDKNCYKVSFIKAGEGNNKEFKKQVDIANIKAGLDLIEKQKPEVFKVLKESYKAANKNGQKAIYLFIGNSVLKDTRYKKLAYFQGNTMFLKKSAYKLEPSDLGLLSFERHQSINWKEDLSNFVTVVRKEGYQKTYNEAQELLRKTEHESIKIDFEYKKSITEVNKLEVLKNWRIKAKALKLKKLHQAKIDAQKSFLEKLSVLNEVFKWEKDEDL